MPLFFFVSGFLYRYKPPKCYFYGKVCSLLIPYIIVQFTNWFLSVGVSLLSRFFNVQTDLESITVLQGYWFIIVLLFVCITYYFFDIVLSKFLFGSRIMMLFSFISIIIGLCYSYLFSGVSTIVTFFVAFFYFAIGVFLRKINMTVFISNITHYRIVSLFIGFAAICITFFVAMSNSLVTMARNEYGNPFLFFISSLLGIIGLYLIGFGINSCHFLEFYGKNTLIILTTQFPVYKITLYLLHKFCDIEAIVVFGCFFITCFIEVIVILFVNKFFPMFAGRFPYDKKYNEEFL